jgi:hypothetical protein
MPVDPSKWVQTVWEGTSSDGRPGTFRRYADGHTTFTPKASSAPASSPQAAAPSGVNGLPPDPTYDATVGGLGKTRDNTLAGLRQQREARLIDFGYNASYDANGTVTGLTFDPSNPQSRAAQMRKAYQQAKAGTQNSYASQGQLYAGSRINAQNTNDSNMVRNEDAMQKALLSFLAQNRIDEREANNTYETGVGVAGGERLQRAPDNPLYNDAPSAAASVKANGPDLSKWVQTTWKGTKNGRHGTFVRYGDGHVEFKAGG